MPITTQIKSRISAFAKKVNKRMRNRKQQSTSKKSRKNKKDKG